MKKTKKEVLDLAPFLIVVVSAIISISTMIVLDYVIKWQHYLGIVFLILNVAILLKNHQLGVLFLGLTLLLGVVGLISFDVGILGSSLYWTPFDIKIPLFIGNPLLFLWLLLHFFLSGRFYTGIITKAYWKALFSPNVLK
jgi:hypothetical protein